MVARIRPTYTLCSLFFLRNWNIVVNGKDHVYDDDETLNSKNINICQFERNPNFETTIRARLNPKHVDECARIVQETTNKICQAVVCRWHVCGWSWVGPDSGESFRGVSRGKVSTMAIVIPLAFLPEMIWSDKYVEKKGPTHRSERLCLDWDRFGNCVIPINMPIWNLRGLRILSYV